MITIICGIPGAGKTSCLTYKLVERMCDYGLEDYFNLKHELVKLRQGGFSNVDLPTQKHLCFADYSVKVNGESINGDKQGEGRTYSYTMKLDKDENVFEIVLSKDGKETTYTVNAGGKTVLVTDFSTEEDAAALSEAVKKVKKGDIVRIKYYCGNGSYYSISGTGIQ